ncbi:MAG: ABC transporter ATP-binding protein [Haliscomenobacter sp.]|nr:ABC transporter ATP-binding protein [Haliscomenobacter sp.]MBK8654260.1 ABC transporter ATP-binding protein [Haliscomenobacter sp.]MBV6426530.1 putative ABC transporter ATP-binding protein YknY [Haliscomenobacter sp.]
MAVIKLDKVSKIYDAGKIPVQALNQVNLEIEAGEFTAIVGPSGSGKTTLLNIIGGLDRPSSGDIEVGGVDVDQLSDNKLIDFRKDHIGFVFQSYNLIPVLTALENVEFVMLLQKRSRKERLERAKELLQAVGLEDKLDKRPSELSGGQQQRVAVARALAPKPSFILADEPTANLDSTSAGNLLDIMAKLNAQEGITFVFSTHDPRVIERARRVVTLVDGAIASDVRKSEPVQ